MVLDFLVLDFLVLTTVVLLIVKLCGIAITWIQVCVPLFLLTGILIYTTTSAVIICCKLVNKYGLDKSAKIVDKLLGNLIKRLK